MCTIFLMKKIQVFYSFTCIRSYQMCISYALQCIHNPIAQRVTSSICGIDISQKVGNFLCPLTYMMHFSPPKLSMVAPLLHQEFIPSLMYSFPWTLTQLLEKLPSQNHIPYNIPDTIYYCSRYQNCFNFLCIINHPFLLCSKHKLLANLFHPL